MKWYRIEERAARLRPLSFIIGGRGIGKTYGTIDYILGKGEPFIYLRNTGTQLDESSTDFGNPFKAWNRDHGREVIIRSERRHSNVYEIVHDEDGEKRVLRGYAAALSTFENMRGVDLSEVKYVLFDEFVERRTLPFKQFETFANFYETVNRNRELLGQPALQVFLLSNSQSLDNEILAGYGCIPIIEQMIRRGQEEYKTDLMYINLPRSEVSEAKRNTVNYRLTEGTQYYQEALENTFAYDSFADIRKRPVIEYTPVCQIDDMYIWQHKSSGAYYVCRSASNQVPAYNSRDNLLNFLHRYGITLKMAIRDERIEFSEFLLKSKLIALLD